MQVYKLSTAATVDSSVTDLSTEAVVASATVPGHLNVAGRYFRVFCALHYTSTEDGVSVGSASSTMRPRLRLGGVAGDILADGGAHDVQDDDVVVINGEWVASPSLEAVGKTIMSGNGIAATVETTFKTSAANGADFTVDLTMLCSDAVSQNIFIVDTLRVELFPGVD